MMLPVIVEGFALGGGGGSGGWGGGEVVQVEGGDVGAVAEVLELVLQGVF